MIAQKSENPEWSFLVLPFSRALKALFAATHDLRFPAVQMGMSLRCSPASGVYVLQAEQLLREEDSAW
jgi:hypothetical protein